MQTKQYYTAAFRSMSIDIILSGMRADSFEIVDLDKVGCSSKLPRASKSIRDFTNIEKTTRKRAILETERRYCGNSSETINDASTVTTERYKIAVIIDPHTCNLPYLKNKKELRNNMIDLLIDKYVRYGRVAEMYQRQKRKEKCEIDIFNKQSAAIEETHDVGASDSDNRSGSEYNNKDSNEYIDGLKTKLQKSLRSGEYFVTKLTGNPNFLP